ncbi:MAG: hypothetical protein ACOCTI_05255 [Phycisphaeraceae bacterium]
MKRRVAIQEARHLVPHLKAEALRAGRIWSPGVPVDTQWRNRRGAFRCMYYNQLVRRIHAIETLIEIADRSP